MHPETKVSNVYLMYIILAIIFPFLVLLYLKMTHCGQFLNILGSIISDSTGNSIKEKNEKDSTPETWQVYQLYHSSNYTKNVGTKQKKTKPNNAFLKSTNLAHILKLIHISESKAKPHTFLFKSNLKD